MQTHILDKRLSTIVPLDVDRDAENVRLLQLQDGRRLAYTEYGDRNAYPLIHCHSHGSSRLEAASFHKAAIANGFRIIAVDRPGVGLSDYFEHQDAQGFALDLLALADKLRCKQFGLLANGGGASYALALAAMAPARVQVLLGLSCQFPLLTQANAILRKAASIAIKLSIYCRHFMASHTASRYLPRTLDALSFADRRLLENPKLLAYVENDLKEALRQGVKGLAQDSALQFNPVKMDCSQLQMPCHFWQGSADSRHTRHLAEAFISSCPQGRLHELANRGRLFYLRNVEEVLASANSLLGRAKSKIPANAVSLNHVKHKKPVLEVKSANH